ncbi:hypothetical protein BD626DRAFT_632321 [Schizophyllum amplum]|uniref:F-box domain-containing protein n=1 Tax=Schizophyllum amplum TaxID=97359 RepID=A0A550C6U9_9AGAR|nr:hypothetical protein BD626DRAFT_632321 [Auriculariopsis ampla]
MSTVERLLKVATEMGNIEAHRTSYTPDAAVLSDQLRNLEDAHRELLVEVTKQQALLEALQTQIAIHKALLAPIRRLPFELLSIIFWHASTRQLLIEWEEIPYRCVKAARKLAQVSHIWREVIIQTAALWASVVVDLADKPISKECTVLTHLGRTAEAPLDMFFVADGTRVESMNHLWSLVRDQSYRWETAAVWGILPAGPTAWPSRSYPMLRELIISTWWDQDQAEAPSLKDFLQTFADAPQLRKVSLTCSQPILPIRFPELWHITHLDIDRTVERAGDAAFAPCIPALMQCAASLRSCRLFATTLFRGYPKTDHIVSFPVLENLTLLDATVKICRDKLACFTGLLKRSSGCPELRSVTLKWLDEHWDDVSDCISSLPPSVQHLSVTNEGAPMRPLVTPELIGMLTRGHSSLCGNILPGLRSLSLSTGDGYVFTSQETFEKAVTSMRDSRMEPGTTDAGEQLAGLQTFEYDKEFHVLEGKLVSPPLRIEKLVNTQFIEHNGSRTIYTPEGQDYVEDRSMISYCRGRN